MTYAHIMIYNRHTYMKIQTRWLIMSHIIVFLKQSTCYAITPDTHQWFRINGNEITHNHKTSTLQ